MIRRRLYSIVALVEAADLHVDAVHTAALSDDAFVEGRMIDVLQKYHAEFMDREYNAELTVKIVRGLKGLYTVEQAAGFDAIIGDFTQKRAEKIAQLVERYATDDRVTPLLFQPEAFLIFAKLRIHPHGGKPNGLMLYRSEAELRWIAAHLREALRLPASAGAGTGMIAARR